MGILERLCVAGVLAGLTAGAASLPIAFEALADGSGYWSRGNDYNVVVTKRGVEVVPRGGGALHVALEGGRGRAPHGVDRLPGYSNYFIGNDASKWRTEVPHFAKVDCGEVYPGIHLIYYGNQKRLEYDLVVRAGADPARIRLAYREARSIAIDASGELVIRTEVSEVHQAAPQIYQQISGVRQPVVGRYRLLARNRVGFEIAAYDRTRELVIDPMLTQVLGFGGTAADSVGGVAIDAAGNRYLAITTSSPDFPGPTAPPKGVTQFSYAGIVKLDPTGATILFETYFGGTMAPFALEPEGTGATAIALDSTGNIYLGGFTGESDFPLVKPINANFCNNSTCYGAGFMVKLDPSGSTILYSTSTGASASNLYGGTGVAAIAVDAEQNAYALGGTISGAVPITPNVLQPQAPGNCMTSALCMGDIFVLKLAASGQLIYGTYLAGNMQDTPAGIAVDADGDVFITGSTLSMDFPTEGVPGYQTQLSEQGCPPTVATNSCFHAFVAKLNPEASGLVYFTYLEGNLIDGANAIAVDSAGNAYVAGTTDSTNFPVTVPTSPPGLFLTVLDPTGTKLVFSTTVAITDFGQPPYPSANPVAVLLQKAGGFYVLGDVGGALAGDTSGNPAPKSPNDAPFTLQFDASFNVLEALTYGSIPNFLSAAAATDPATGNLVLAGNFSGTLPPPGTLTGPGGAGDIVVLTLVPTKISVAQPTINAVVNGASFVAAGIAPGEIATIFGTDLTSSTGINLTSGLPLPTTFQNVTVMVNGSAAALFAVDNVNGQQQINFQVPFEVSGTTANVAVVNNMSTGLTVAVPVLAVHPGIFNYTAGGLVFGAILHANFQLADTGHPVVAGETVLIYCTGLGAVSSPPADGAAGNGQETMAKPVVSIGGANAAVSFSGLAPGFVGLYQINAQIPAGVKSGNQPVTITMGSTSSNSVLLPVH
ncbi:MAG: SBBP repeat-containing protein [Bryobacteraceae bacterium]|jgi:uncharacterized protein (TIGR03437 family)